MVRRGRFYTLILTLSEAVDDHNTRFIYHAIANCDDNELEYNLIYEYYEEYSIQNTVKHNRSTYCVSNILSLFVINKPKRSNHIKYYKI